MALLMGLGIWASSKQLAHLETRRIAANWAAEATNRAPVWLGSLTKTPTGELMHSWLEQGQTELLWWENGHGDIQSHAGLASLGPKFTLRQPKSVGPSAVLGNMEEGQVVHAQFRAPQGATLHWRRMVPKPRWLAPALSLSLGFGALAGLMVWLFMGMQLRSIPALLHSMSRVQRGDFCQRVPVNGCGEMQAIATSANASMDALFDATVQIEKVYVDTALALARTVEAKDRYTSGHSQRVARYCVEMGEWLGLSAERIETLRLGALLHDIGKVAVPDAVLLKPGPLDDEEFEEMRRHPAAGDRILAALPGLRDIADIARSHHEKWDGTGYPLGVSGEAIPLEGRICAIADAYDALVTKRSYKEAMPLEQALDILEKDAGTHFDPELVQLFVAMKRGGKGYKSLGNPSCAA